MSAVTSIDGPTSAPPARRAYLVLLTWAFAAFGTLRVVAYLPTLWAIVQSGDSSQHSVLTWLLFACSNVTMALWLLEQGSGRVWRAVLVNVCNAAMCVLILLTIVAFRA